MSWVPASRRRSGESSGARPVQLPQLGAWRKPFRPTTFSSLWSLIRTRNMPPSWFAAGPPGPPGPQKIDVVSFARPLLPGHTNLRQLGPFLVLPIEQHQPVSGARREGGDVTSVSRPARRPQILRTRNLRDSVGPQVHDLESHGTDARRLVAWVTAEQQ